MPTNRRPVLYAILAALCYGLSAPFSKLLLGSIPPALLAALLYLGAGFGMLPFVLLGKKQKEARIAKAELPYVVLMVVLDILAPILLMLGLAVTAPATVSLLNNFEIVATAVIALAVFREAVGKRMGLAILFITLGSAALSVQDVKTLALSPGAALVIAACCLWGLENNCTRRLSIKNPLQIVAVKGIFSGLGSLIVFLLTGRPSVNAAYIPLALLLGLVSYGLSIYCYILAQRSLGAARTSAYYAIAPFIGVLLSFLMHGEAPAVSFYIALPLMLLGAYLAVLEKHSHRHLHEALTHEHRHSHADDHHTHTHIPPVSGEHSHEHTHEQIIHQHPHTPDTHHIHTHEG